ncbi:MAG: phosphotransferase [Phycisphaerales bacterium]|nr:phosphotransferase [Phycisphaerales bacterium]
MTVLRERFAPEELKDVLARYEVGLIESMRPFARGSRHAPKLILCSTAGKYLLKRRAAGRDDPRRVAFTHALLIHLRRNRFPVPRIIHTLEGPTVLRMNDHVYELFELIEGDPYDRSLEQTQHAGRTLAKFHNAARDLETRWPAPQTGYHALPAVLHGLNSIPTTVSSHDSVAGHEAELLSLTQELYERVENASESVEAAGYAGWLAQITHGDWHPGNLLFRRSRVLAVVDLDSARMQPAVTDVANGMLQFSILRSSLQPEEWPSYFDESRMRRFFAGYLTKAALSPGQRGAIPDLMIESLIAECVVPVAATGSLGPMPGFGVLQMVRRKVRWILDNRDRMKSWLLE